jgi:dynein intermediate chain, cytosolic
VSTEPWPNDVDGIGREAREKDLEKLKEDWLKEKEEELRSKAEQVHITNGELHSTTEKIPIRTLEGEELDAVVTSEDFREFLDKSSKIADRALDEPYDILVDYAQGSGNFDDDEDFGKGRSRRGRRVKQISQFWDEKWSRKRMISDVNFSPKVRTLLTITSSKVLIRLISTLNFF